MREAWDQKHLIWDAVTLRIKKFADTKVHGQVWLSWMDVERRIWGGVLDDTLERTLEEANL
jgi:hypothetical protein